MGRPLKGPPAFLRSHLRRRILRLVILRPRGV